MSSVHARSRCIAYIHTYVRTYFSDRNYVTVLSFNYSTASSLLRYSQQALKVKQALINRRINYVCM